MDPAIARSRSAGSCPAGFELVRAEVVGCRRAVRHPQHRRHHRVRDGDERHREERARHAAMPVPAATPMTTPIGTASGSPRKNATSPMPTPFTSDEDLCVGVDGAASDDVSVEWLLDRL